jgi:beta-phosphoglucomutase-like phosphatase (HAD superfamily)
MRNITHIFWDCDDTLFNSELIAMGVAIDILSDATLQQRPALAIDRPYFVRAYAGWHFDEMITAFEKDFGVSLNREALSSEKKTRTLAGLTQTTPISGIDRALQDLAPHFHMAAVTSSEFDRVNLCFDVTGLNNLIPVAHRYSAHDSLPVPKHKPAPDIYLYALEQEGALAKNTVAVEDSPSGVRAAVAAGIPVFGFVATNRVQSEQDRHALARKLMDAGVVTIIHEAKYIPATIRKYNAGHDFSASAGSPQFDRPDAFQLTP